jgi:hypothetical protein
MVLGMGVLFSDKMDYKILDWPFSPAQPALSSKLGEKERVNCPFYISFTNPPVVFVYTAFCLKRGSTIRIHYREPIRRSIEGTS